MARTQPARRRRGREAGTLDRAVTALAALCSALNDPANTIAQLAVASLLLVAETVLCLLIIRRVPYTEIDWVAYMQEVGGYLEGERDYAKMRGDTGPLVYPAGFVYLFAWLQRVTGGAIVPAQYIFAGLYVATQAVAMALHIRAAVLPPWALGLLCASRRLHSIYVLRLFNDCWATLAAYAATLALQSRRWVTAVVLYSLAVSVKMNVLLMAPGVLAVLVKHAQLKHIMAGSVLGVLLQLGLGLPFLASYPRSYLTRAFEFSRVFTYKWSVNWQFLPEPAFLSRQLALVLLFLHLRLLWSLAQRSWLRAEGGMLPALRRLLARAGGTQPGGSGTRGGKAAAAAAAGATASSGGPDSFEESVLFLVFSPNIAGIVCARTIHYQFYSWYFHTLPFLLLRSRLPRALALAVLAGIEIVYNVYPPRPWASGLLLALHMAVLGATLGYTGSCPADDGTVAVVPLRAAKAAAAAQMGNDAAEGDASMATAARRRTRAAAGDS
ncbi:hypothetical protein ABPG75_000456 [Micractinium tetrahymenae]